MRIPGRNSSPYLVRLEPEAAFNHWVFEEGWGRHWGIFARSSVGLNGVRTHLRKFLMVKDPEGKQLYFRWYDPRVLRIFLPTCNAEELATLFGPFTSILCEAESADTAVVYTTEERQLKARKIPLTQPRPV